MGNSIGHAVDIAQYADARLELLYRGHVLAHTGHDWKAHLGTHRTFDDKTLNERIDQVANKTRGNIARVMAEIDHQNHQREHGIHAQPSRASNPPCEA